MIHEGGSFTWQRSDGQILHNTEDLFECVESQRMQDLHKSDQTGYYQQCFDVITKHFEGANMTWVNDVVTDFCTTYDVIFDEDLSKSKSNMQTNCAVKIVKMSASYFKPRLRKAQQKTLGQYWVQCNRHLTDDVDLAAGVNIIYHIHMTGQQVNKNKKKRWWLVHLMKN